MSTTSTPQPEVQPTQSAQTPTQTHLPRGIQNYWNDDLAQLCLKGIGATRWKLNNTDECSPACETNAKELAYGTALEIERHLKAKSTPATIQICIGNVTPSEATKEFVEEAPAIQSGAIETPEWATDSTKHAWVIVKCPSHPKTYLVDSFAPSQITGKPTREPQLYEIESEDDTPTGYSLRAGRRLTLTEAQRDPSFKPPWNILTPTWPGQTPDSISPIPADGGRSTEININDVIHTDAQEGLEQLPTDSVDAIVTSPPYRLQRSYEDCESVYNDTPTCDHDWQQSIIYSDTPVREDGGAGFQSDGCPEKLSSERHRKIELCQHCDAYRGQLGHEPSIEQFISHLVDVFEQCRRVLKPDGSLFVNIADSYDARQSIPVGDIPRERVKDSHTKSLIGLPERFLIAMIEAGWIAREHFIWTKPNPTPEGRAEADRARKAHEHIYRFVQQQSYADTGDGPETTVFELSTASGTDCSTAPMPLSLPKALLESVVTPDDDCLIADPFAGSGTVLEAAAQLDQAYIGFEISEEILATAKQRLKPYNRAKSSISGQVALTSFN